MYKRTCTFTARTADGRAATIHEFTNYEERASYGNPTELVVGMKHLKTADGLSVNRVGQGEYVIVTTGVTLRSDDPAAP